MLYLSTDLPSQNLSIHPSNGSNSRRKLQEETFNCYPLKTKSWSKLVKVSRTWSPGQIGHRWSSDQVRIICAISHLSNFFYSICKLVRRLIATNLFEPTCATARWALMRHFLSVLRLSVTGQKFRLDNNSNLKKHCTQSHEILSQHGRG